MVRNDPNAKRDSADNVRNDAMKEKIIRLNVVMVNVYPAYRQAGGEQ